jgi:hypothetical protein
VPPGSRPLAFSVIVEITQAKLDTVKTPERGIEPRAGCPRLAVQGRVLVRHQDLLRIEERIVGQRDVDETDDPARIVDRVVRDVLQQALAEDDAGAAVDARQRDGLAADDEIIASEGSEDREPRGVEHLTAIAYLVCRSEGADRRRGGTDSNLRPVNLQRHRPHGSLRPRSGLKFTPHRVVVTIVDARV